MGWKRCNDHLLLLRDSITALQTLPHPSACEFLTPQFASIWLKPRACPTDNEGCGGIRKREAQEKEERERAKREKEAMEAVEKGSDAATAA